MMSATVYLSLPAGASFNHGRGGAWLSGPGLLAEEPVVLTRRPAIAHRSLVLNCPRPASLRRMRDFLSPTLGPAHY